MPTGRLQEMELRAYWSPSTQRTFVDFNGFHQSFAIVSKLPNMCDMSPVTVDYGPRDLVGYGPETPEYVQNAVSGKTTARGDC
jgi:hypothetical protein